MSREAWIVAFLAYMAMQEPASLGSTALEAVAGTMFDRLGQFEPRDVAEAEWDLLPH